MPRHHLSQQSAPWANDIERRLMKIESAYGTRAGRNTGLSGIIARLQSLELVQAAQESRLGELEELTQTTGWITPTLLNSWTQYGDTNYSQVSYRRDGNIVRLKGLFTPGTDNTVAFTLPAGFRPAKSTVHVGMSNGETVSNASAGTAHTHTKGNAAIRVTIGSNGDVQIFGAAATWFSIDGITFVAEQ